MIPARGPQTKFVYSLFVALTLLSILDNLGLDIKASLAKWAATGNPDRRR